MATLAEELLGARVEDFPRTWAWLLDQMAGDAQPSRLRWLWWEEEGVDL